MRKPQVNISLDPEKDKDIIDYIEDMPKSWVFKQAIRLYMNQEKTVTAPPSKDAADEIGF